MHVTTNKWIINYEYMNSVSIHGYPGASSLHKPDPSQSNYYYYLFPFIGNIYFHSLETTESVLSPSLDQLPGTVCQFKFEEQSLWTNSNLHMKLTFLAFIIQRKTDFSNFIFTLWRCNYYVLSPLCKTLVLVRRVAKKPVVLYCIVSYRIVSFRIV